MVAYSFKSRFAGPILAGTKCQTIRKPRTGRSRHVRPGEEIQLYSGMRTKHCKLIARVTCKAVREVQIGLGNPGVLIIDGAHFNTDADLERFAKRDGFESWSDLNAFWAKEHRGVSWFTGVMIQWEALR